MVYNLPMTNKYLNLGKIAETKVERLEKMRYLGYLDKFLHRDQKVLDMGCGDGVVCEYLQNKNMEVLGVDINKDLVDTAKKNGCRVIVQDAVKFLNTHNGKKFKVYLMLDFIEHLEMDQVETILDLIPKRSTVVIKTPNVDCLMGTIAYLSMPSHKQPVSKQVLRNILLQNGYEVKKVFSVDFLLSPLFSPRLIFPILLVKLFPAIFDGGNYVCMATKTN